MTDAEKLKRCRLRNRREKTQSYHWYCLYQEATYALHRIQEHKFGSAAVKELSISPGKEIEMLKEYAGRKIGELKRKE